MKKKIALVSVIALISNIVILYTYYSNKLEISLFEYIKNLKITKGIIIEGSIELIVLAIIIVVASIYLVKKIKNKNL